MREVLEMLSEISSCSMRFHRLAALLAEKISL
jgi:hypothetical protein